MHSCESCGKTYKHLGGLNNHTKRCGAVAKGGAAAAELNKGSGGSGSGGGGGGGGSSASLKPTTGYTKEDLEQLEKRKQARLNTILQLQQEEQNKKAAAMAAAAAAVGGGGGGGGAAAQTSKAKSKTAASVAASVAESFASSGQVITNNSSNVGNEEHNASFNIKYVKRSEETQEVVRAVTAAANEYCKGRIIVTSDEPAPGGGPLTGISTSVNANGTTVYNHPTRTISIIETPPEEVSPEEEHDITLEKMTYLILSLIQNNNKLTKENHILRSIVARIDPACFE